MSGLAARSVNIALGRSGRVAARYAAQTGTRLRFMAWLATALLLAGCGQTDGVSVGDPAPEMAGPRLETVDRRFELPRPPGEWLVVNIWGSWCAPCRREHPQLMRLAEADIPVYGINHRDTREAALEWLYQNGDPFRVSVLDRDGRIGARWGAGAVPQTFLVDPRGIVRFHAVGPLTDVQVRRRILDRVANVP